MRAFFASVIVLSLGCSGQTSDRIGLGGAGAINETGGAVGTVASVGGTTSGTGGVANTATFGAGGNAISSTTTGGATSEAVDCAAITRPDPGIRLTDLNATGSGACANTTVQQFLSLIGGGNLVLAPASQLMRHSTGALTTGGGTFAYLPPNGGLRVIVWKGTGSDCMLGCDNNWYTYYEADSACQPVQVGSYSNAVNQSYTCRNVTGAAMWDEPIPEDPTYVCGADLTTHDSSGTYQVAACGHQTTCAAPIGAAVTKDYLATLSFTLTQDPTNLEVGTVVVQGSGDPFVDGVTLPATINLHHVTASYKTSESSCTGPYYVTLVYDFDVVTERSLTHTRTENGPCKPPEGACESYLDLDLSAPQ